MKYICQKQFWKQILALWKKKYSIFQTHVKILWKEIKFIHIVDLRSGCKKRNDCKNQSYHHVFMKNTIINHLRNRISQRIRRAVFFFFYTFILMNAFNIFKSLKIFNLQSVRFPPLKYMYIFSTKLQVYYITIYAINLCQRCDSRAVLIFSTRQERWLCTWLEIQEVWVWIPVWFVMLNSYHPVTLKKV